MKEYNFGKGKRGAVVRAIKGRIRITIRIDDAILEWFPGEVDSAGGGGYQTFINMLCVGMHFGRGCELKKTT